jgi:hypothetical protein
VVPLLLLLPLLPLPLLLLLLLLLPLLLPLLVLLPLLLLLLPLLLLLLLPLSMPSPLWSSEQAERAAIVRTKMSILFVRRTVMLLANGCTTIRHSASYQR